MAKECGLGAIDQVPETEDEPVPSRGFVDQYPIICDPKIHTAATAPATKTDIPRDSSADVFKRAEQPCTSSLNPDPGSQTLPPSNSESRGRASHTDTRTGKNPSSYASRPHSATRLDHNTGSGSRPTVSRVQTDVAGEIQSMKNGTRREPSPYSYTREAGPFRLDPPHRSMTEQFLSPAHTTESPVSTQRPQIPQERYQETREYDSSTDSERRRPKKTLRFADTPLGPAPPPRPRKSFSLPESRSRAEEIQNIQAFQPEPQRTSERRKHHHHRHYGRAGDHSTDEEGKNYEPIDRSSRSSPKVREAAYLSSTEGSVREERPRSTKALAPADPIVQNRVSHRHERPRLEEPLGRFPHHARTDLSDDDSVKRVYRIRDMKSPMTPPSVTTPNHMEDYFTKAFHENALRHSGYIPHSSADDTTVLSPPTSPPRTPKSERRGRQEYFESPSSSPHRTPKGSRPPSLEESQIRDLKAHHSLLSQATAGAAAIAARISPPASRSPSSIEAALDAPNHVIVTKSRSRASSPTREPARHNFPDDDLDYVQPRLRALSSSRESSKPIVHRTDSSSYIQPRSRASSSHRDAARSAVRTDSVSYDKPRSRAPSPQREPLRPIVHRADSVNYVQPRSRATSPQREPLKPTTRGESSTFDKPRSRASSPQREVFRPIIRTDFFTHGDPAASRVYHIATPQVKRPSTRDGLPTTSTSAYPPPVQPQRTASFTAYEHQPPHTSHFATPLHVNTMSNMLPSSSLKVPPPAPLARSLSASSPVERLPRLDDFALPPCPRSQPTQGLRDWITIRDVPNFDICPKCAHALAATRYRNFLVRSPDKPYNRNTVCALSRPWVRIAVTQCIKRKRTDFTTIRDANTLAMGARPCEGANPDLRLWFRVPDSTTDRVVPNFLICSACLGSVHAVYPELEPAFTRDALNQEGVCDLRCTGKDFYLFTEQIEKVAEKCRDRGQWKTKYMQPLVETIKRVARRHSHIGCPRDRMMPSRAWHYMDTLPEFAICETCFEEVVWPVKDKPYARDISKAMKIVPPSTYKGSNPAVAASNGMHPTSCQLYSDRMRRLFGDLVNGQVPFEIFKHKARERQAAQYRLIEMNRMYEEDQRIGWDRRGEIERNWAYWRSLE